MSWCIDCNLWPNIEKTKEMIVYFGRSEGGKLPLEFNGKSVENVKEFKFLGRMISLNLKWERKVHKIVKLTHQR